MYPSNYDTGDDAMAPGIDLGGMAQGGRNWEPQDDYSCYDGGPYKFEDDYKENSMGDMADYALSSIDWSPPSRGYSWGSRRYSSAPAPAKKKLACNKCGDTNVYWFQHKNGSWCLFDNDTNKGHECKVKVESEVDKLKRKVKELEAKIAKLEDSEEDEDSSFERVGRYCVYVGKNEKQMKSPEQIQREAQEEYDRAPRCPHCGDKIGFSFGTGDCGCSSDPDVGW